MLHNALFYERYRDKIKCLLCPHNCIIDNNQFGLCSVRINKGGNLKTINYGEVTAMANDPIEKKPLYHFKPTKSILSVGSYGCNFTCDFCQNYRIAQDKPKSDFIYPNKLIEISLSLENNIGIAFTYNEPSIWFEYIYDTSKQLKEKHPDLNIVLVTNGYIQRDPLLKLLPYVDAMNIDLKSFRQDYYKKICGGDLKPILRTIEESSKKCHVEVTTLLVNDFNDSREEIGEIASYIGKIDNNIPLHLSRYFPSYKMDCPPTEIDVMLEGREIAEKYLNYVYLGNVANVDNSTYCPECRTLLVDRNGFFSKVYITDNVCSECGHNTTIII